MGPVRIGIFNRRCLCLHSCGQRSAAAAAAASAVLVWMLRKQSLHFGNSVLVTACLRAHGRPPADVAINGHGRSRTDALTNSVEKLKKANVKTIKQITELKDEIEKSLLLHVRDCHDIYISGKRSDGVYTMYVGRARRLVKVYCDMTTDGGGWTVFQRRKDGSVDFYRNWNDYENGFGNPTGEFWLGNKNLYLMTSEIHVRQRLRVDLTDWEGNTKYATYDNFKVGSAQEKYKLASRGAYNGTAGDSLRDDLGVKFSTKDQDNDLWNWKCTTTWKGGWWYGGCGIANLNGIYLTGRGVKWNAWKNYSMKISEMKFRPFYV